MLSRKEVEKLLEMVQNIDILNKSGQRVITGVPMLENMRFVKITPINKNLQSFFMSTTMVSNLNWYRLLHPIRSKLIGLPVMGLRPKVDVTLFDVQKFITHFNSRSEIFKIMLPTFAQWEYAVTAGKKLPDVATVKKNFWTKENSENRLRPIGTSSPNKFGIYDLIGNAWEWVYTKSEYGNHSQFIVGGSYKSTIETCLKYPVRVMDTDTRNDRLGFRLVLST